MWPCSRVEPAWYRHPATVSAGAGNEQLPKPVTGQRPARITVVGDVGVDEDELVEAISEPVGDSGDHQARIAVPAQRQRHVVSLVDDRGDVVDATYAEDPSSPEIRNASLIAELNATLAGEVHRALDRGHDVLTVGGDCTVELGVVAGARSAGARVGLLYIDLDFDLNTPQTGDGAADWMGIAHLLDLPGCDERLSRVGDAPVPLLTADDVRFLAAYRGTDAEQELVESLGLARSSLEELRTDKARVLERLAGWSRDKDVVAVHVDVDVLDRADFPLAEEVRDVPAMYWDELVGLMADVCALERWRTLTVCEINPGRVERDGQLESVVEALAAALPS